MRPKFLIYGGVLTASRRGNTKPKAALAGVVITLWAALWILMGAIAVMHYG